MSSTKQQIHSFLIGLLMLSGILLTSFGFWKSFDTLKIPWQDNSTLTVFYSFLFIIFIIIQILSLYFRSIPLAALVVGFLLAVLSAKIWSFAAVISIVLSSVILGRKVSEIIKLPANWLNDFLLGIGLWGTFVGLSAYFKINFSGVYIFILAVFCFAFRKTLSDVCSESQKWFQNYEQSKSVFDKFLQIFVFTLLVMYFTLALMPELSHDPLAMHLFIPSKLASWHYWDFDVNKYIWAVMPMLGDWIYSLAYLLGGEVSARLANFCFITVLFFIFKDIAFWMTKSSTASYAVGAIFLSSPLTFGVGANLFVESIWTSFVLASVLNLLKLNEANGGTNQLNKLILIGALMALAVASKLIAVLAIPLCLVLILLYCRPVLNKNLIYPVITGILVFVLLGCIPYLSALILTQNPIFPFFNKVFQSPLWLHENFSDDRWNIPIDIKFPYTVTFETGKYLEALPGAAGFQWLLFLPVCVGTLIISKHKKALLLLALSIFFIALVCHSTLYLRYMFPAYGMLCVIIGIGIIEIKKYSRKLYLTAIINLLILLFLNLTFLSTPFSAYQDFPIQSIWGTEARTNYLKKAKPIRHIIEVTNALNINRRPVAMLSEPFGAGLASDALYTNWYNRQWEQKFNNIQNESDLLNLLAEYNVEFLIVDRSFNLKKEQIDFLEKVTDRVIQLSSVELRRIKSANLFTQELLLNPSLDSTEGWVTPTDNLYDSNAKIIIADEKTPTVQRVKINSGITYLARVTSRCASPSAQGRVQINWQDSNGKFIKPDIKVFNCTKEWNEDFLEVIAPEEASYADFYLSAHTEAKIEIKSASFKR